MGKKKHKLSRKANNVILILMAVFVVFAIIFIPIYALDIGGFREERIRNEIDEIYSQIEVPENWGDPEVVESYESGCWPFPCTENEEHSYYFEASHEPIFDEVRLPENVNKKLLISACKDELNCSVNLDISRKYSLEIDKLQDLDEGFYVSFNVSRK